MSFKLPTKKDPNPTMGWFEEAMNDKYSDTKDIERRLQDAFLVGAEAMKRGDEGNV